MNGSALESFLASIYVDSAARARFTADPFGEARQAGLSLEECASLASLNQNDLELVARSLVHKRQARQRARKISLAQTIWKAARRTFRIAELLTLKYLTRWRQF
jgi:hypothetical protein